MVAPAVSCLKGVEGVKKMLGFNGTEGKSNCIVTKDNTVITANPGGNSTDDSQYTTGIGGNGFSWGE